MSPTSTTKTRINKKSFAIFSSASAVGSKVCVSALIATAWTVEESLWDSAASMGIVVGAVWAITASVWSVQVLCGMMQPLCGLLHALWDILKAPDGMQMRYVG